MSYRTALIRTIVRRVKYNTACLAERYEQKYKQNKNSNDKSKYKTGVATVLFSSVLLGYNLDDKKTKELKLQTVSHNNNDNKTSKAGEKKPELPIYTAEEVSRHDNKSSCWVTYKHGVYDVTVFLSSHPGGEQIMNAAGHSIEPFWNVYGMHNTKEVHELLESYRIGNLHDDDIVDHSDDEMWAREPFRDPRLIVKTAKPFNAEIPPKLQIQHFDTPSELFYVRQHMPVPELQADTHRLTVVVEGRPHTFDLPQLVKQFPQKTLRAALMCAGNRRSEMNKVKEVKGLNWQSGAISNAVWTGVYLRDVLVHCGVDVENTEGKHVILQGADIDATGEKFSTSIPLSQAVAAGSRLLLATHMNGAPLAPDHGYPLRAVVPGAPAVRSVKWLESITVSEKESSSHWHQRDYRSFNSSTSWETADFPNAPPVYSLPVTSAICDPADGELVQVKNGCIEIKGYAYSGGGAKIVRVDVTADGGTSWLQARLQADVAPPPHHYAWTLWAASVPVHGAPTEVEVWAKATDSNFNTQPETFDHIWNIRGILSNAYHRIKVKLQH